MQLDIFSDTRDVQLRNDAAQALLRDDPAAARAVASQLAASHPADPTLPPLSALVALLEARSVQPLAAHDALAAACAHLQDTIAPAASRVLGADATAWLALRWAELAQRAATLPFDASHPDAHAAPLWLRAGRWDEAGAAVERIPSWRRIPAPLAWMAQARYHRADLDGTWSLLAELAWLSTTRLEAVLDALADPLLRKLRTAFEARFGGGAGVEDLCWWPAWLLTERASLAPLLAAAQRGNDTPPEQALRLLVELLGLEKQGRQREVVQRRKALRDLNAALYAAYLATR